MIRTFTLLILCALSSAALANLNDYLASSGASKESLEQVEYSEYGAYLHFDQLPKVLFLRDSIKDGDIFDFRRALRKHPSISALVLDSGGGLVKEALLIAGAVSDRGMTTYVPTGALCASACSFIYFAGKSRLVKGKLGVHQFFNSDNTKRENVNEVQQNTQYTTSEIIGFLNAFDTPAFVYEEMFASSNMYYFTKEERMKLSSHESLATLTSVDTFIGNFTQEAELQELKQRIDIIKTLQTELKRLGCYDGLVDGVIGSSTKKALGRYLERAVQSSDLGADSLVKLTKKLTKEKRMECVKEKAVSAPKVVTPKVSDPKIIIDEAAAKQAYRAAFDLIRERQYDESIIALRVFIKDFPEIDLAGDAHYWLGEVYFVKGNASLAALSFESVIYEFPEHRKIPDALYKAGVAYQNTNKPDKANRFFQRVILEHPYSDAARLTKERIGALAPKVLPPKVSVPKVTPKLNLTSDDRDRISSGTFYNDRLIETSTIEAIVKASPSLKAAHVSAVSVNGIVLLIGQVPNKNAKTLAGKKANGILNVRKVHNQLLVSSPASYVVRASDTLITTSAKSRMVREKASTAKHINVATKNGIVYLMGVVTRQEAEWAVKVASKGSGIQRIVKVFEYIN